MTSNFLHLQTPKILDSEGIGGRIKQIPEDFIVGEIIENQQILDPREKQFEIPGRTGLFLHFILIKRDIDTSDALDWIAKIWKTKRENINIAGSKDKRALTAQRVSVWGLKDSFENGKIKEIDLPTIKTKSLALRLKEIRLGELWGNFFDITLRDIQLPKEEIGDRLESIQREIKKLGGILNSFGMQRFGEIRPITHLVGRKLVEGDIKEAIRIYVGKVFEGESERITNARNSFWKNQDAEQALDLFPSHLRIERKLLFSLQKGRQDYKQAFSSLPIQLQKLFVHAYQSFLFNRYLKIRYELYSEELSKPISGEILRDNSVYIPLIGANTKLEGQMGEIYMTILEEEGISLQEFQKPFTKKIGGRGAFRSISFEPKDIRVEEIGDDDLNEGKNKVNFNFKIQKGSYATEFLKEIIKQS